MLASAVESLVEAVVARDAGAVATMLDDGLPPDSRHEGSTALYRAAVAGETDLAELLLRAGADPNLLSGGESEGTPLCAAACWGFAGIVRALLAHGANPNLPEDEAWTPLRWAAAHGHAGVARELLAAGADPDLRAPIGDAARRGSLATVRLLLEFGANPSEPDLEGSTAIELADWWVGKDVEGELVARVELLVGTLEHGRRGGEISVTRTPLADGTELVSVRATFPDGTETGADVETGHEQIAALLRSRRVPA
jgi:ankyrin repeat protein